MPKRKTSEQASSPPVSPKPDNTARLPKTRVAVLPDQVEHRSQSLDKHGESLRYKAAYLANLVADDITALFRYKGKKDHNYLKALVWNFGVLFDKATGGQSAEAVSIRIPAKLLDNIKAVIAVQVAKKDKAPDTVSSTPAIESTAYEVVVADTVAPSVIPPSLPSPSVIDAAPIEPGGTLAPTPPGGSGSGTGTPS